MDFFIRIPRPDRAGRQPGFGKIAQSEHPGQSDQQRSYFLDFNGFESATPDVLRDVTIPADGPRRIRKSSGRSVLFRQVRPFPEKRRFQLQVLPGGTHAPAFLPVFLRPRQGRLDQAAGEIRASTARGRVPRLGAGFDAVSAPDRRAAAVTRHLLGPRFMVAPADPEPEGRDGPQLFPVAVAGREVTGAPAAVVAAMRDSGGRRFGRAGHPVVLQM
jgi:hypothetical protein